MSLGEVRTTWIITASDIHLDMTKQIYNEGGTLILIYDFLVVPINFNF